ncbi:MAG: DNA methyltransferase [Candidatus Thiodiazotropha sp.]
MDSRVNTTDYILEALFNDYLSKSEPVKVNFRELVSWVKYGERSTHMLHPYPAKLLVHIPHFFLHNRLLSKEGDFVLDPFCGSGTVPLESTLASRRAIGFDNNPLAHLIAKVKVTPIRPSRIQQSLNNLIGRLNSQLPVIPEVVNLDYWYSSKNIEGLGKIKASINKTRNECVRDFLQACFSVTARKLSYADPKVSVPVRLSPYKSRYDEKRRKLITSSINWIDSVKPEDVFKNIVTQNISRMRSLYEEIGPKPNASIYLSDARELILDSGKSQPNNSVQLIITSPPYAGAQKYIRASSLSLGWLSMAGPNELRPLAMQSIGREQYAKSEYSKLVNTNIPQADIALRTIYKINPLRAHIASNYLIEMEQACSKMSETLKSGGYLVLVIGNNQVCGIEFLTKEYLKEIFLNLGLSLVLDLVDDIHSRGLMTKRNKTASVISTESVLIFQK